MSESNGAAKRTESLCGHQEVSLFSQLPNELLMLVLIEKAKQEEDPALAMVNREYRDNFLKQFEDVLELRADDIDISSHKAGVLIHNLHRLDKAGREHYTGLYLDNSGGKLRNILSAIPSLQCINSVKICGHDNLHNVLSFRCFPNLRKLYLPFGLQSNIEVLHSTFRSLASCCPELVNLTIKFDNAEYIKHNNTLTISGFPNLMWLRMYLVPFTQVNITNMPDLHTLEMAHSHQERVQIANTPRLERVDLFELKDLDAVDLTGAGNLAILSILHCLRFRTLQLSKSAQAYTLKCVTMDMRCASLLPEMPQLCRLRLRNLDAPVTINPGRIVLETGNFIGCNCNICHQEKEYLLENTWSFMQM